MHAFPLYLNIYRWKKNRIQFKLSEPNRKKNKYWKLINWIPCFMSLKNGWNAWNSIPADTIYWNGILKLEKSKIRYALKNGHRCNKSKANLWKLHLVKNKSGCDTN